MLCLVVWAAVAPAATVVDVDLRRGAPPGFRSAGVTWTDEGLLLPTAPLTLVPKGWPVREHDHPLAPPPFQAELPLPLTARTSTITLVLCPAGIRIGQDLLFTIGRRSAWLSAQQTRDGGIQATQAGWWVHPARTAAGGPVPFAAGVWHIVSVAHLADDRVTMMLDGQLGQVPPPAYRLQGQVPPRPFAEPDQFLLSFVDHRSGRHLHGLVARIVIDDVALGEAALQDLHRRLAAALPPPPRAAACVAAQALPPPETAAPAQAPGADAF